jgi:AraC-like DNA-binding protein
MNKIERPRLVIDAPPFVIEIACVGIVNLEPGEIIRVHKHQLHEFHYVKSGEIKIALGKKQYNALENSLYIIKPGVSHYQYCIKKSSIWYFTIAISQWWRPGSRRQVTRGLSPVRNAGHDGSMQYLVTGNNIISTATDELKQLLDSIYSPLARNVVIDDSMLVTIIKSFLTILGKRLQSNQLPVSLGMYPPILPSAGLTGQKAIDRAVLFIKQNFAEPLSLKKIAGTSYVSGRHFRRLFKKAVGFSPAQYLNEIRLQKAIDLLKNPQLKIETVKSMAGFRNRDHFFRFFSKRTGLSPDRFRKNVLATANQATGVFDPA